MQRVCVGASVAFEHRLGQKRAPLGRWVLATSFPEKTLRLEGEFLFVPVCRSRAFPKNTP